MLHVRCKTSVSSYCPFINASVITNLPLPRRGKHYLSSPQFNLRLLLHLSLYRYQLYILAVYQICTKHFYFPISILINTKLKLSSLVVYYLCIISFILFSNRQDFKVTKYVEEFGQFESRSLISSGKFIYAPGFYFYSKDFFENGYETRNTSN